jgi:hypothetical protein
MTAPIPTDGTAPTDGTPPAVPATPPTAPATDPGKAPTFTGEFDPERAARLVENLRTELEEAKAKIRAREDAEKTDLQKAQERAEAAEAALVKATLDTATAKAAQAHKIPDDLLEFITGATAEEIEAKAKRLGEKLAATDGTPADNGTGTPSTRPTPRLVPGQGSGDTGSTFDPAAIAKAARRR